MNLQKKDTLRVLHIQFHAIVVSSTLLIGGFSPKASGSWGFFFRYDADATSIFTAQIVHHAVALRLLA